MSKQKIELSFEAFKRWAPSNYATWLRSCGYRDVDALWEDLCAEAEKREPVVRLAVIDKDGNFIGTWEYIDRAYAEKDAKEVGGKVIKLQEVNT